MTELETAFWQYHAEHPEVYSQICATVKELVARGWSHYSIAGIIEDIRLTAAKKGIQLKIANAHRAYYARLYMHEHPEHKGFFTVAALTSKNNQLRMEYE